jgi:CYTH domain-containing protein
MTANDSTIGRYARLEREQRWLAAAVPASAEPVASITDLYISGTRLRLRHRQRGSDAVYKLGQKVRVGDTPEFVYLTSMYLSADEHARLMGLPGASVHKTRWKVAHGDQWLAVDEFHDRHQGLVLTEVELAQSADRLAMPSFAAADVTEDDRFSGGSLAFASSEELAALQVLVRHLIDASQ